MNRKKILAGFLISSLVVAGGVAFFDSVYAKSALLEAFKDVGKKITKTVGEKLGVGNAKRTYLTLKGLAVAFGTMVVKFQQEIINVSYYDEVVSVEVPLKIPEPEGTKEEEEEEDLLAEEEEPEAKERTIGLDYDFKFIGSGDINKEIEMIESIFVYTSPVKSLIEVGGRKEMPIYASRFLEAISKLLERYKTIVSILLPIFGDIAKALFTGMQEILKSIATLLRMKPEMIFKFKMLKLLHSAEQGRDNITYMDIPVNLIILLSRLARSVNIDASKKLLENRGIKNVKEFRKKLYFKDTGIAKSLKSKAVDTVFPVAKIIFESKVISMPQWMLTEYKERQKKKEATKMERLHSNVRLTRGHLRQSAYFLEVIIPWLDKLTLDKTDSELFVKTLRVHAARRFQGIMKLLGLSKVAVETAAPEGDAPVGEEETAPPEGETVLKQEMDKLAWVKAMIQDRWIALIDVLDKAHKTMLKKAFFTKNHKNKVASLLAQVKAEKEELYKLLESVTWNAKLPEGVNIDEIGVGESPFAFLPDLQIPERFDDPFLELLQEVEGAEAGPPGGEEEEGILLD